MDAGIAYKVTVDSAGTHNYHPGRPPDGNASINGQLKKWNALFRQVESVAEPIPYICGNVQLLIH